ncbi:hypothetical protein BVRB_6g137870 [Beta vulgaris subsp. vulgaris]|nr:hypothetical protein BVRB_6g137870 [Beta vulgaris subsp. vulgaris]
MGLIKNHKPSEPKNRKGNERGLGGYYSWVTDSEVVPQGKAEKNPVGE